MRDLDNKRIVVTGAGGGLGRALVACLSAQGASVVACDAQATGIDSQNIACSHRFDLTDAAQTQASVAAILAAGPPDCVIACAGATWAELLADLADTDIRQELHTNLEAVIRFSAAFLPAMRRKPGGASFVFVSSVNALRHHGNPVYSAAKAGLHGWMRAIATEEGRHGIRANVVAPGSIRTPAWDKRRERDPDVLRRIQRHYPLGRLVSADEVAQAIAFLASDRASGISGVVLPVDAGLMAANLPFLADLHHGGEAP